MYSIKKLLVSICLICFLFIAYAPSIALAEDTLLTPKATWYNQGPLEFYTKVFGGEDSEIFGERYVFAQIQWVQYSLLAWLVGLSKESFNLLLELIIKEGINLITYEEIREFSKDTVGVGNLFGMFYDNPPASGISFVKHNINKFDLVQTAHAQTGFGYGAIQLFQPLWAASRNIAYGVLVLITVSIAFAIMFKVKINPQLIVSIQSTIPKVVTTMILITFSYAIAGFLIDLMYVVFGFLSFALDQQGVLAASGLTGDSVFDAFKNQTYVGAVGPSVVTGITTMLIIAIALILIPGWTIGPVIISMVVALIFFFAKGFIMLAQTYLSLVINIIFGPFVILSEAIPFVKASSIGWMKTIVADLLIFTAFGFLMLLNDILAGLFVNGASGWSPPYLNFNPLVFRFMIFVGIWSIVPELRPKIYAMFEQRSATADISSFQKTASDSAKSGAEYWSDRRNPPRVTRVETGHLVNGQWAANP